MPTRPPNVRLPVVVALFGLGLVGSACSSSHLAAGGPGGGGPGATDTVLDSGSTVPSDTDLPAAVVAQLVDELPRTIGVVLPDTATSCIQAALTKNVAADALTALGLDGDLTAQPPAVQVAVYTAFDTCVSPNDYAAAAAPILVVVGVEEPPAECVFRKLRESLGFSGLYTEALSKIGEVDPDPALDAKVAEAYRFCQVDPTKLTVPAPEVPTTTVSGSSTTAPRPTVPYTGPSTTVRPPAAAPTDVVGTTTTSVVAPPSSS